MVDMPSNQTQPIITVVHYDIGTSILEGMKYSN